MRLNNRITIITLCAVCAGCVEPFEPRIDEEREVMVIDGVLNDRDSIQTITVSRSAPYNEPQFIPVTGCVVRVEDNLGDGITFLEEEDGIYRARPEPGFAFPGKSYRLSVFTPDGQNYASDYDSLLACPPVEQLTYEVEVQGTSDPDKKYYGVRFFVDVKGSPEQSRNFMWKYEETWEYHAYYPIHYIWDGVDLQDHRPELKGVDICYMTSRLKEYQVGSSARLETNELHRQPIYFVSNQTPRLEEKYSLLVFQHSLSKAAYEYLERLKSQSGTSGSLYETQPASASGNICNVDDPGERVLGYFFASQVREKRIMVDQEFDFRMKEFFCPLDTAWITDDFGWDIPYFMWSATTDGSGPRSVYSYRACHNCL
jgi:hypothetical protein